MTTAKQILEGLHLKYINTSKWDLFNTYIFAWESDYFCIQKSSKYCYEIEVKISHSDFIADFKKTDKHKMLSDTSFKLEWTPENTYNGIPNRFYYCCPLRLIEETEIPSYAGLIYYSSKEFITVKKAPLLHNKMLELDSILVNKFYYYWLNERNKNKMLEKRLKELLVNNYGTKYETYIF